MVLVELYAGLAALSLSFFGARPPVARIGSKSGYVHAIRKHLDITTVSAIVWVDADPALCNAWRQLVASPSTVLATLDAWQSLAARDLWLTCRDRRGADTPEGAAAWWVYTAGARGGVGGFKGSHKHRPSVDGFIPSRESLRRRLTTLTDVLRDLPLTIICAPADGVDVVPDSVLYLDPPYEGTTGYGDLPISDPAGIAARWAREGARVVALSERSPVQWSSDVQAYELSSQRMGQARKTLTTSTTEWLSVWKRDAPRSRCPTCCSRTTTLALVECEERAGALAIPETTAEAGKGPSSHAPSLTTQARTAKCPPRAAATPSSTHYAGDD